MFKNLEISNKLYSLKLLLKDSEDILFIDKMIDKYKTEINVDFEYTNKELGRMSSPIYNIYNEAKEYCFDIYDFDIDTIYNENYEIEFSELFKKFKITKLKVHKEENTSLRNVAKESLKIIIKEEFIKLILKYKN